MMGNGQMDGMHPKTYMELESSKNLYLKKSKFPT